MLRLQITLLMIRVVADKCSANRWFVPVAVHIFGTGLLLADMMTAKGAHQSAPFMISRKLSCSEYRCLLVQYTLLEI